MSRSEHTNIAHQRNHWRASRAE